MKNKLFRFNSIILSLFTLFFIYQNIITLYLSFRENINLIYPYHHEVFYTRIIYYGLEITTFTHFTIGEVFKVLFNFIQSIGIIEILYILLSIPLYLGKEKDNRINKIYISVFNIFLIKLLIIVISFVLGYLTYNISQSIVWLIIKIVFGISILFYVFIFYKLIKYQFD
jgi:hypothetical protein